MTLKLARVNSSRLRTGPGSSRPMGLNPKMRLGGARGAMRTAAQRPRDLSVGAGGGGGVAEVPPRPRGGGARRGRGRRTAGRGENPNAGSDAGRRTLMSRVVARSCGRPTDAGLMAGTTSQLVSTTRPPTRADPSPLSAANVRARRGGAARVSEGRAVPHLGPGGQAEDRGRRADVAEPPERGGPMRRVRARRGR